MCCRTAASKAAQSSRELCCLDPTVTQMHAKGNQMEVSMDNKIKTDSP